jgi:dTDP-4-amino-4,6-dideoxygalactose transaminase
MINVTKTFLPKIEDYNNQIKEIWLSGQITNSGPKLKEFEGEVVKRLKLDYGFKFVTNGTLALQLAIRALDLKGSDIITTPFSYVASTSSILYEGCRPVFVDIDPNTLCIDTSLIEKSITNKTRAILAVHVFGNACEIESLANISRKYNLKIIYDASHCFGLEYKGASIFDNGDMSTTSFHATKIIHTIEGGGIFAKDENILKKLDLMRRLGHSGDDHITLGTNAKSSEFQAAMGLANLKHWDYILESRKKAFKFYEKSLRGADIDFIKFNKNITSHNYSYFPVIFRSEEDLIKKLAVFNSVDIYPRRYFFPSLNTISYINSTDECPISEDISRRILCLPIWSGIDVEDQLSVINVLV